ncbi:protein Rf1, mitochondrial-like [Carex rostrata]
MHAPSLSPFCCFPPSSSLSQFQSQSESPSDSRHGLPLFCYANRSKIEPLRIPNRPKSPPSKTNVPCDTDYLNALVRKSDPSVFPFFNRITQTEGIFVDHYTYGIMIKYCVQMNQLNLAFSFLGRLLKEGQRVDPRTFSPILQALCSENRIDEAVSIVIDKMPKMECIPDMVSYTILMKGLCSKGNTGLVLQLFFKMVKHGGEYEPSVITYSTVIDEICKVGELTKAFGLYSHMYSAGVIPDSVTYTPH